MQTWKKILITATVCTFAGVAVGISGILIYQHNTAEEIQNNTVVTVIDGEPGTIQHKDFKNKKETLEFKTVSTGKGEIKTVIKKDSICPKLPKNNISAQVYAGMYELDPIISFGMQYSRNVLKHVSIMTGFKVDTDFSAVKGFQLMIGAGVNF